MNSIPVSPSILNLLNSADTPHSSNRYDDYFSSVAVEATVEQEQEQRSKKRIRLNEANEGSVGFEEYTMAPPSRKSSTVSNHPGRSLDRRRSSSNQEEEGTGTGTESESINSSRYPDETAPSQHTPVSSHQDYPDHYSVNPMNPPSPSPYSIDSPPLVASSSHLPSAPYLEPAPVIHAYNIEPSLFGVEPIDEFTKEVADWLWGFCKHLDINVVEVSRSAATIIRIIPMISLASD